MADTGHGTTIAFGGFSGEIVDIPSLDYFERAAINTSHMGLGGSQAAPKGKTFILSDLYDPGTLSVVVNFESGSPGPVTAGAAIGEVAITFPDTDDKKWTCQGGVTKASLPIPMEDRMLQTIELKFSGDWNFAAA